MGKKIQHPAHPTISSEEIKAGNELIATVLLNWYMQPDDERKESWWVNDGVSQRIVYSLYNDTWKELPFHKDWNWIHKALDTIRYLKSSSNTHNVKHGEVLVDRFELNRYSVFISLFIWNEVQGKWKTDHFYHAYVPDSPEGSDCDSYQLAVFKTLAGIAGWIKAKKEEFGVK